MVVLLLGWTIATGAHWDVIQVAAWGRMLARNAHVQPLGLALATTFSPEGMCGVCHTVQAARLRQDENSPSGISTLEKAPLLLPQLRAVTIAPPAPHGTLAGAEIPPPSRLRPAPLAPPPRHDLAVG